MNQKRLISLIVFSICFFLSGLTSLVYEIVWSRYLTFTFGSSSIAITTVLTVFMAGLGIGSYLVSVINIKKELDAFEGCSLNCLL